MARPTGKLSDISARARHLAPGRHSDGGGLYLSVTETGSRSWVFMWARNGRRREMGLGAYPAVSLAKARGIAARLRETVAEGQDPIEERNSRIEITFAEGVERFLAAMEVAWRSDKHRAQWRMTLTHYCRQIERRPISAIETRDILAVLQPMWEDTPETASRLRGRIERVLDFAAAQGWRERENPARWRGHLKNVLPARKRLTRGHHAAMPYAAVPNFVGRLRQSEAVAARALEFLILTAGRTGEVIGAVWSEIDWDLGVWSIPAVRMKAARDHRVPLSERALEVLRPLYAARTGDFIFPGLRPKRPLSASAMEMLLRRLKADQYTCHGFRSSFRDFAGDRTHFPREVAEAALAHRVGDATELAYRRGDALEKRRELMKDWADYISTPIDRVVIPLRQSPR